MKLMRTIAIALVLGGFCGVAQAATVTFDWWTGAGGDQLFSNSGNWASGKTPGANTNVLFDADGMTDCIIDGTFTVKSFAVDGGTFLGYGAYEHNIYLPAGSWLTVNSIFDMAGTLEVEGKLTLVPVTTYISEDTDRDGNFVLGPGGVLQLAPGTTLISEVDTTFTVAGTTVKPAMIQSTLSLIGGLELCGNVWLENLAINHLGNTGLELLSDAPSSVYAKNLTFNSSGATTSGSQYLYVDGTAWEGYIFDGFRFVDGGGTSDPSYTVESQQHITFRHYATGAGDFYGDASEDPATGANVTWEPADLLVQSVVPSNSNPQVNDTISVSVTVRNAGSAPVSNFAVDLFYNEAAAPSVGDTGDLRRTVLSLNPGASTVVTFPNITSTVAETWDMYAIVDTDNVIVEIDETVNNVGGPAHVVWSSAGLQPDLTITGITPSSATPDAGSTISVDVAVTNNGTSDVGSFRVDLFYDRATAPGIGDIGNQNKTVAGLAAGNSTVVTFTGVTNPVPDDWNMYAIVDTLDSVAESDETNNIDGPQSVQWRGVDLKIASIAPSNSSPVIGDTISIDVTVENQGNVASAAFWVGLFENESPPPAPGDAADDSISVATLDPGASTIITFNGVTTTTAGIWNTYVIADNALDIAEYNETNNMSGPVNINWRAPDLIVTSITPSNSSPTAGDTISVDVAVKNQGNADAGSFDVGLFYNLGAAPSPGDSADQTQNVVSLAAGIETVVTFTGITNLSAETWQMYAIADNATPPGDVAESNEANNVKGPVEVIWGSAGTSPDLIIVSVVPSNADPAIGELIDVAVTVENQGDADAGAFLVALFYDEAAPPAVGAVADMTSDVSSLAAGNQTVVTFQDVTNSTVEVWSSYAIADNTDAITESDEDNNVSSAATITWHAPDLRILSITPSLTNPDLTDTISVDVVVRNDGDADAGSFDVGLFLDRGVAPNVGDPADRTENVASLAAATQTTVTFTGITGSAIETWFTYAAVDNGLDIDESNETNNTFGPSSITWHGADLVIASVVPSDSSPTTSDTISVDVTIRNLGDRDATNFDIELFYNRASAPSVGQAGDATENVALLGAGSLTVVTFTGITNAVEEVWKSWAIVDNGTVVTEGNESNNIGGPATITWGAPLVPDLVIVSIVPSDAAPNTGDTISVDVTIANNGTADASLFDVGLYYDLGAPPTTATTADQTKSVGTVAAGNQKVLTFTGISSAAAAVWDMYAFVDNSDVIVESNENNNTAGPVQVNWGAVTGITVLVPNGSETWESSTTQQIEWEFVGNTGGLNVSVEYSLNNGSDWTVITPSTADDGTYDWEIPLADSTECLVRVTSEGGSYSDESDSTFTIEPVGIGKPNLKIVSISPSNSVPNAGDTISVDVTVRNIGNAASGLFYVDLFHNRSSVPAVGETGDQSQSQAFLAAGSEANIVFNSVTSAGPGTWEMYAIVDTQGYVVESNEGDNIAGPVQIGWSTMVDSFNVTSPNGFEVLSQGATHQITWTWTGSPGALVNIELSTDGGATWSEAVSNTLNDGDHAWAVPLISSADCRLRISNSTGSVTDVSDDVFAIQKAALTFFGGGCSGGQGGGETAVGQMLILGCFLAAAMALRKRTRRNA
ncbi:MAG: hypothetical protein JW909_12280 [Planctomycetes bacterium]|nr:hypothetical protein [Planctomycetota bacterium]